MVVVVDLNAIKMIIDSSIEFDNTDMFYETFNEKPKYFLDEELEETYVLFVEKGVSILYDDEGEFECLFFHFNGDEDVKQCELNVLGFTFGMDLADVENNIKGGGYSLVKSISLDGTGGGVNGSKVIKKENIYINIEFNKLGFVSLLSFMDQNSYPS
ncbi:hypothetical protein EXT42_16535 [Pseudoalteromonas sp. CO302Y]|uniref:hypothetical protein n=2 Tax=unclassified Pseudoalteromonas TaxID=194690 RepID=UPI001022D688|nr:hypothetical protein EXT42_16535 [Pseudoalteromonas sp. CO302Y]